MLHHRMSQRFAPAWTLVCAFLLSSAAQPAAAQSCPSSYTACDNGGCCLSSDYCCPTLAEGCCAPHTPYCCGDGSCAASPSECGNIARNACTDYEVPCGEGCAPAGAQCCDLAGHYCPPQGVCTSETTCIAGTRESPAELVIASPAPATPGSTPERRISPLLDPPDGTERSCQLALRDPGTPPWVLLVTACSLLLLRRRP